MIKPELHKFEEERIKALFAYEILDTPAENEFDEIVKLASSICEVPISLISLMDQERQWFKASVGVEASETPRDIAFCAHTIHNDELMLIQDATQDPRFSENPLVTQNPHIRFYAGMPLLNSEGLPLGTLCVIDTIPRNLTETQIDALKVLSKQIMKQLELKLKIKDLKKALKQVNEQKTEIQRLNNINSRLQSIIGHDLRNSIHNSLGIFDLYKSGSIELDEFAGLSEKMYQILEGSAQLLDNLQRWGVAQREGKELNIQSIHFSTLIDKVFKLLGPSALSKDNRLVFEGDSDAHLSIDPDLMEVVIRNLVQNANKYTNSGIIRVGLKPMNNGWRIKVEDTGIGMSPVIAEKLFNWAERKTTNGTIGEKGSGLGLLICKEFVEKMGGMVRLNSEVNIGTSITIELPSVISA